MKFLFNLFRRRRPEPETPLQFPRCTKEFHEFTMEQWTDINGDAKCIHCGKWFLDKILDEQPVTHFKAVVVREKFIQWQLIKR